MSCTSPTPAYRRSWNITPGWLTFAAPYLDIFGAEAATFADADFIRAIAYHRPCTDLPYTPRPAWEFQRRFLHGVFAGAGHDPAAMKRAAPLLRQLDQAGWEPLTRAVVAPATCRVERFGSGERLFLVVHNPAAERVTAKLQVDLAGLGWTDCALTNATGQQALSVHAGATELPLDGRGTVVLAATRR